MADQCRCHRPFHRGPDATCGRHQQPANQRQTMTHFLTPEFISGLQLQLRSYLALCEEILNLTRSENQALLSPADYQPVQFNERRTALLPQIDSLLAKLRSRRLVWQQVP